MKKPKDLAPHFRAFRNINLKCLLESVTGLYGDNLNVCECGAGDIESIHTGALIDSGAGAVLVEPRRSVCLQISKKYPAAKVFNYAVSNESETVKLMFSRNRTRIHPAGGFSVKAKPFEFMDTGLFDLVILDMEGAEWSALQTMTSRPAVLMIETHAPGPWINPNLENINAWCSENGYVQLCRTFPGDTVWIKS